MKQILVIGSTGNVGRTLVRELAAAGEHVKAGMRNPAGARTAEGVQPVAFDYSDAGTYAAALEGTDRVFLMGPSTAAPDGMMIPFVREAAKGGRKLVLMTAMGTELDESTPLRKVERAVEATGAPHVFLRPNWFLDNFHSYWIEPVLQAGIIPLPAGAARTSFIDARDIAASAAAVLRTGSFDGKSFMLTGPEALTYTEAAAVISRVAGKAIRYVPVTDEEFVQAAIGSGVPEDLARYLAKLFEFVRAGGAAEISPAVEMLTGRKPRGIEAYAADHAAAWK